MNLNAENVFGLLRSTDEFPVDFDEAWQWIGYGRKGAAKEALLNAGFFVDIDFRIFPNIRKNSKAGRPSEVIQLTIDCFKSFAMMAGTAQGRQVRQYFLKCERDLKEILDQKRAKNAHRVVKAVVQDDADPWVKRFEDEFFDEAYRVTGWNRPEKGHPACMGGFINTAVYDYFPDGVPERLRQVNPKNKEGIRLKKHHQHLTPLAGLPILGSQKAATIAVMRLSPSGDRKKFRSNMAKACGTQFQVELPFMDDLESLEEAS
jgi:phage anti-repressor protein